MCGTWWTQTKYLLLSEALWLFHLGKKRNLRFRSVPGILILEKWFIISKQELVFSDCGAEPTESPSWSWVFPDWSVACRISWLHCCPSHSPFGQYPPSSDSSHQLILTSSIFRSSFLVDHQLSHSALLNVLSNHGKVSIWGIWGNVSKTVV